MLEKVNSVKTSLEILKAQRTRGRQSNSSELTLQIRSTEQRIVTLSSLIRRAYDLLSSIQLYENRRGRRPAVVRDQFLEFDNLFNLILNNGSQVYDSNDNNLDVSNNNSENQNNNISERERRYLNRNNNNPIQNVSDQTEEFSLNHIFNRPFTEVENDLYREFETIFSCNVENSLSFANIFEKKQRDLVLKECRICKETSMFNSVNLDNICTRCESFDYHYIEDINRIVNPARINPFSQLNNMCPGDIPDQLNNLTLMERILISPIKPIVQVNLLFKQIFWFLSF